MRRLYLNAPVLRAYRPVSERRHVAPRFRGIGFSRIRSGRVHFD